MRKLSVNDIIKDKGNCYSFVIAVAKRAREISDEAAENGEMLEEKPIKMAIQEFVEGKFRIAENQNSPDSGEEQQRTEEDRAE